MINQYIVRKWAALLMCGFLPATSFYIGLVFIKHKYNFFISLGILIVSIVLFSFIGSLMLNNPFRRMIEGSGLLAFDINSTGIIQPFNLNLRVPYVSGKVGGQNISDTFNRSTVMQIAPNIEAKGEIKQNQNGNLILELTKDDYNKARFALYSYPVLIYNSQIKSLLTKDRLSDMEKDTFSEHTIIYLNKKVEELTSVVRDFGRYVVELTKPKSSIFAGSWWIWLLIIGFIIIMAILFGPKLIAMVKGPAATAGEVLNQGKTVVTGG